MIYIITLNPSIDYVIQMDYLNRNQFNCSKHEIIFPGGRGINTAIILKEFEVKSILNGYVAGSVGQQIKKIVDKYKVENNLTEIENYSSAVNIRIVTLEDETIINTLGELEYRDSEKILYKYIDNIQDDDWVVLSANIVNQTEENIYQKICEIIQNKEVKLVVDIPEFLTLKLLKFNPFLIKLDNYRLEKIFNVRINNNDEIIKYIKILKDKGARNILISHKKSSPIFITEENQVYEINEYRVKNIISNIGVEDCEIGGFIAGFELYQDLEKAFKMSVAAGTASKNTVFLPKKDEIYDFFNQYE